MRTLVTLLLLAGLCWPATKEELRLLPNDVALIGKGATQRLLVVKMEDLVVVAERTAEAKFTSSNPAIVKVDETGVLEAIADGSSTITAQVGGSSAKLEVNVQGVGGQKPVSFVNDLLPLFTKAGCNSGACHGALVGKGGLKLSLRGFNPEADHFVLTRQAQGRRIDRADPARSLFLLKPSGQMKHGGGQKVDADSEDYALLRRWISEGAVGPKEDDAKLVRLEVFPSQVRLKPEESVRPVVRAVYSDGVKREVTRWARLGSTDENVAIVETDGKVVGKGNGEAALTVGFGGQVALATLTSPFPNAESPAASYARSNFIDDAVNAKLRSLRLPASSGCTDREFIRRAHLDVTGTLPTPEEIEKFLADSTANKRAKLIDKLLDSSAYVDYWTYKRADLFLVATLKLPQQAVWAYQQFLRQSVADNVPWDQFARSVLTAQGSNLENGAVNYFWLHQETARLAETTSLTFMGMSLACAKCHNHPLEKWTQDQYWSYANLFSRVSLQNGDRPGEVIAKSQSHGEVLHLRRGIAMPPTPPDGVPLKTMQDRRQYFADWLTAPDNPYFAKAIINRVWRHYLGRGLIEAEDDVRLTNPASNDVLLASLEADFKKNGYDLKKLMRLILNSATYQRSSKPVPGNEADDRFYSHYLLRRLPAEVILDAYSDITGVPTAFSEVDSSGQGSPSGIGDYPPGTRAVQLPDTKVVSRFLVAFGRPEREAVCACERGQEATVSQALHLNNGQTLNVKLRDEHCRVEQWLKDNIPNELAVTRLFELALGRPPATEELKKLTTLLTESEKGGQSRREQLEDLFWAVLTSREFLFNR